MPVLDLTPPVQASRPLVQHARKACKGLGAVAAQAPTVAAVTNGVPRPPPLHKRTPTTVEAKPVSVVRPTLEAGAKLLGATKRSTIRLRSIGVATRTAAHAPVAAGVEVASVGAPLAAALASAYAAISPAGVATGPPAMDGAAEGGVGPSGITKPIPLDAVP